MYYPGTVEVAGALYGLPAIFTIVLVKIHFRCLNNHFPVFYINIIQAADVIFL